VGLQYLISTSSTQRLTDHPSTSSGRRLGSTVAVTNSSGTLTSQQRYLPFGAPRAIPNSPILATDFGYTGQRLLDSGMGGIMDYKARFFSPALMRFLQPDTIIPNPANPQAYNRFTYVTNNPILFNDPTGHDPSPIYLEFIQAAISFFQNVGYQVVGNPTVKSIYANGADLVFKAKDSAEVLAVELKNTATVNLSTLGRNAAGNYGGSIARVVSSANRFITSSNSQLREESQAILRAAQDGSLRNALYTTAKNVSDIAKDIFDDVYSNMPKTPPPVPFKLPRIPLTDFIVVPKCFLDGSCMPKLFPSKPVMQ
jgi:RHS repeat-associated protein